MKGFLIDENLPGRLTFVPSLPLVSSSRVLHPGASDSELWEFARAGELAIVTKDADFSSRILASAAGVLEGGPTVGKQRSRSSCATGLGPLPRDELLDLRRGRCRDPGGAAQ